MKFLVDANVLSDATKPSPSPEVLEWLRSNESQLTIDAIVLGELRYGILLLPKGKRRTRLETWLDEGVRRMHCLPWDADTGLRWARLLADLRRAGSSVPIKDSMIAAKSKRLCQDRCGVDQPVPRQVK